MPVESEEEEEEKKLSPYRAGGGGDGRGECNKEEDKLKAGWCEKEQKAFARFILHHIHLDRPDVCV